MIRWPGQPVYWCSLWSSLWSTARLPFWEQS